MCNRRRICLPGWIAVGLGTVILLGLVLPGWFWWLLCGLLLIAGGIGLLCR